MFELSSIAEGKPARDRDRHGRETFVSFILYFTEAIASQQAGDRTDHDEEDDARSAAGGRNGPGSLPFIMPHGRGRGESS
jgi:hypothetical protein